MLKVFSVIGQFKQPGENRYHRNQPNLNLNLLISYGSFDSQQKTPFPLANRYFDGGRLNFNRRDR